MTRLYQAELDWREGQTPESRQFGDVYFSPQNGLAETRHVFLEGVGAPAVWQGKGSFTIGETGFGTGLNFLAAWAEWRRHAAPGDRLNYLSVEGFPLEKDALAKALSVWTELSELSEKLVAAYPQLHPGFHRLSFDDGRVTLTLLFGEVAEQLTEVEGRVDAWFLDGFAPSKNPEMWRPAVLEQIARLSRPGTRLATFTAAGQVRRDLAEVGFVMEKAPGFGHKRECLRGAYKGQARTYPGKPWFAPAQPGGLRGPVAVIGGGVAGLALARRLKQAGAEVTVYERDRPGAVGSGNRVGLIQPRLTASDSLDGRFNAAAYLHACRFYDDLAGRGHDVWAGPRGVLQLARDENDGERFARLVDEARLPAPAMQAVTAGEASDIAGITLSQAGLCFPHGGGVWPKAVLAACAEDIPIVEQRPVRALRRSGNGWLLQDSDGNSVQEAAVVILANGPFTGALWDIRDLPLTAKRGQVAHLAASEPSQALKLGLSFGGYVSPAVEGSDGPFHVTGASFKRWDDSLEAEDWRRLSDAETSALVQDLQSVSPAFADVQLIEHDRGRASLRATTSDHWPVVGAVHNGDAFEKAYGDLHHGRPQSRYAPAIYEDGLYAMTGLGSRGFQTAPLLADLLVDQITGAPWPLPRAMAEALHCGRYQIRRLRRPPRR